MRRLPDGYADLLEEKYLDGLSIRTMARRRGQSEKAVESTLTRARAAFREIYHRLQETHETDPKESQFMSNTDQHEDFALEALLKEASGAFAPPPGLKESIRRRLAAAEPAAADETPISQQPALRPVPEASYGPGREAQRRASLNSRWRRTGRSAMRRIAMPAGTIAAVVVVAVVAYHFAGPGGNGAAFAQVIAAIQKAPWVHVTGTLQQGSDPPTIREEWMGFQARITVRKDISGSLQFDDYARYRRYTYSHSTGKVTLARLPDKVFALGASDPRRYLETMIELEKSYGARLTVHQGTRDSRDVTIFTLDRSQKNQREHVVVFVDPHTDLPVAIESSSVDAAGTPVSSSSVQVDYPAAGPASIYDLGVPADAVVVNELPDPQLEQFLDQYQSAQRNFDSRFIALRTISPANHPESVQYAQITYVDGQQYRIEARRSAAASDAGWPARQETDDLESLLRWWTASSHSQRIGLTIDDGQFTYVIDCGNPPEPHGPPGKSRHTGYQGQSLGWPVIDRDRAAIVPDDYSRENDLIRVEPEGICVRWQGDHPAVRLLPRPPQGLQLPSHGVGLLQWTAEYLGGAGIRPNAFRPVVPVRPAATHDPPG